MSSLKRPAKMSALLRERRDGLDERATMEAMGCGGASQRREADAEGGSGDLRGLDSSAATTPKESRRARQGGVGAPRPGSSGAEPDRCEAARSRRESASWKVRAIQRSAPEREAARGDSTDRTQRPYDSANSARGRICADAPATGASSPTPSRAQGPGGPDAALGRQPTRLARGAGPTALPDRC